MSSTYRIASLLYTAVSDDFGQTAYSTIRLNMEKLVALANEASSKHGAQIMVFPESTTGTLQWSNFNSTIAADYGEVYPAVGSIPCDDDAFGPENRYQHYTTSCLAKNTSMYLVMNIIEYMDCRTSDSGDANGRELQTKGDDNPKPPEVTCDDLTEKKLYLFNALAIYDPSGAMIAKYRKTSTFPLYYDTAFPEDNKEKVDYTVFSTDFGVDFGVLICADATHPKIIPGYVKNGIKNLLLPLFDGGRPPVSTITAIHHGHSFRDGVNIIASQSQTFSGVGIYQAGKELFWNVNPDPISGLPFQELIVVDVVKDPVIPAPLELSDDAQLAPLAPEAETCRWLANEDTEVEATCLRIDVPASASASDGGGGGGVPIEVYASLSQDLGSSLGSMNCSVTATLSATRADSPTTYAMMLAYRNSTQLDEILFCGLVTCADFPDCSKDCPLCIGPYLGNADLTNFYLEALVPDFFEGGDRQMPMPIFNGYLGRPNTNVTRQWASESVSDDDGMGGSRMRRAVQMTGRIDGLMSAGMFYIGFGGVKPVSPCLSSARDDDGDECLGTASESDDSTSTSGARRYCDIGMAWIHILVAMYLSLRIVMRR